MRFADLVEQKELQLKLANLADTGKIPHAVLFSGMEGSGNLAMAYAFARLILCDSPVANDACNVCPNCKKTATLTHPDVFFSFPYVKKDATKDKHKTCNDFLEPWRKLLLSTPYPTEQDWKDSMDAKTKSPTIYISEIRDLHRRVGMRSYAGKKKILIMWMAERMGKEANSLLKLLEEPPNDTLFFLVSEEESGILTTILSRCQRIFVPPPSVTSIVAYLQKLHPDLSPDLLHSIAIASRRNMGLVQQLLSDNDDPFLDPIAKLIACALDNKAADMVELSEVLHAKGRQETIQLLYYGMELMRAMHIYAHNGPLPDLPKAESDFVRTFAGKIRKSSYPGIYQVFQDTLIGIERNGSIKMGVLSMSIELNKLMNSNTNLN